MKTRIYAIRCFKGLNTSAVDETEAIERLFREETDFEF